MILTGIICACLTLFLNYCMGKPGGEFSPYEIFSKYTIWLSIKRLKKIGLIDTYHKEFQDNVNRIEGDKFEREFFILKKEYHKVLYNAAEPFFTWERAVGMCPVCFGFWVSLAAGLCFTQNVVNLVTIVVSAHATIRIFNKFL